MALPVPSDSDSLSHGDRRRAFKFRRHRLPAACQFQAARASESAAAAADARRGWGRPRRAAGFIIRVSATDHDSDAAPAVSASLTDSPADLPGGRCPAAARR